MGVSAMTRAASSAPCFRSMKTAWRLTCQRAQVDNLHFHDLRREAGSRWMDAGIPLATIQRWLGHATLSMTIDTYREYIADHESDARDVERLGEILC